MYTIGQVSEMYNLPISTLRYYDKEGFFPNLMRKGNIRYFSDDELEAIRVIECLKRSGLEIKDIISLLQPSHLHPAMVSNLHHNQLL